MEPALKSIVLSVTVASLLSVVLIPVDTEDVLDGSGEGEDDQIIGERHHVNDVVDKFLNIVEKYEKNKRNCTAGTEFNLGDGVVAQYGVMRFKAQALSAVNWANFFTRIWKTQPPGVVTNEYFFYTAVRSLLESDADLFAAGNCYDEFQYKPNYTLFCPYAYRMHNDSNEIMVKDLSVVYPYLGEGFEFFYQPRLKAELKLSGVYNISKGYATYHYNDTAHYPMVVEDSIIVNYEDGHWGKPYFDCGGGNIWMMTYTVPFFGYNQTTGSYYFKGTSGIDIDLQKVDINQCPLPKDSKELNVFASSDKCKKKTTECIPVPGLGFRRGSYKCVCKKGYFYPDFKVPENLRYYNGSEIEVQYERRMRDEVSYYNSMYTCEPCAKGCETCVDKSPCILTLNWIQRRILLAIAVIIMCSIPLLVYFTFRYRDVKVLKAASPMLLRIILLGALLLYCPLIVQYFEPSEVSCTLRCWFREIGFSISYGALLLKTWRISVVFRVRSAQRIKISDTDLIKRLLLIVLLFAAYLTVRMVVGRPQVVKGTHSSGLHAYQCPWDMWDICAAIAELCLLLWGIRLCIVVRKAPSEFNESRFISWAIYNETLLSLFLNITMFFLQSPANPDLLYLVIFIHTQLTTTVTLAFLIGSKAYLVFKYSGKEQPQTTINRGSKYIAAPKSACTGTVLSTVTTGGNSSTVGDRLYEDTDVSGMGIGNTLEKDIQDEFKRLYMQLEMLKQKNMKLGNPHLTYKLSAMAEAALREEPPDSTPNSPNMNGKRVIINLDDFRDATSL